MNHSDSDGDGRLIGRRPHRSVLVDSVYETIRAAIMEHVIPPGARIGIERLAREMDVSPTPIREALARLEAERLAVKEPLRGYRTTKLLTRSQTTDLFELRLQLEPWAAGRAAEADETARQELLASELSPTEPRDEDYGLPSAAAARGFHDKIAYLAGNQWVVDVLDGLHIQLHLFRLHFGGGLGEKAIDEHRTISEAIAAGDASSAHAVMYRHLELSLERLLPVFDQDGEATPRAVPPPEPPLLGPSA